MSRGEEVAGWLRARFAERPEWLASELIARAWADHTDVKAWWDAPEVKALGVRGAERERWEGGPRDWFYSTGGAIEAKGGKS